MKIETKYSIGDTVWYVSRDSCERVLACETCNDTKAITIKGTVFKCPNCETGHNSSRWQTRWFVNGSSRIGQVRTEFTEYSNLDYERRKEEKREYMLRSTGVGSGTIWCEDKLFPSREEAQSFCDRMNEELGAKVTAYLGRSEAPKLASGEEKV